MGRGRGAAGGVSSPGTVGGGRKADRGTVPNPGTNQALVGLNGYRVFDDRETAVASLDASHADQVKNLSFDEKNGVREYSGWIYEPVNSLLRGGDITGYGFLDAVVNTVTNQLDSALGHPSSVLREGVRLKRQLKTGDQFRNLAPGSVFEDKGFVSTSADNSFNFIGKGAPTVYIYAPKGTRALWVNPISRYNTQSEVIINRGTQFEVLRNDLASGGAIHLRVVGQR